jgi:cysteine desulfurase
MAKALRIALENQQSAWQRVTELKKRLIDQLDGVPGICIISPSDEKLAVPHIVNLSCPGLKSEVLVHALEQRGFYISSRSACSSGEDKPSRILLALGLSEEQARSGLRISLAKDHTPEEIDRLAAALTQVVEELRQILR